MPAVSVIIPAFGHAEYIGQTLDSVFAQTFRDYEIIVVNDGSPDNTADVLRPMVSAGEIRYFETPNEGVAAARNFGMAKAKGEFIAFLDDDDLWPPCKLEWQVAWLLGHSEVSIVSGYVTEIEAKHHLDDVPFKSPVSNCERMTEVHFEDFFRSCPFASPGQTLIRAELATELGGFRSAYWGADDYDFWIRASRSGRIAILSLPALLYRCHAGGASEDFCRMLRSCRRVLSDNLKGVKGLQRFKLSLHGQRWLFNYAGWRLANQLKSELAQGKVSKAWKTSLSFASSGSRAPFLGILMLRHLFRGVRLRRLRGFVASSLQN